MPEDMEWGQHEGSHIDPDGNLLRFGSPVERSRRRSAVALARVARREAPLPLVPVEEHSVSPFA